MAGTSPAMTTRAAFSMRIVTGSNARSSRNTFAVRPEPVRVPGSTLLPGIGLEFFQPVFHGLAQIIAAAAEGGVALADEVALLPGQRQRRPVAVGFRARDHPQEDVVDVAVELGEARIGADRLFHLALGGGAIEARQVLLVGQRTQPFDLLRDFAMVGSRGLVGGIEADGLCVILQRPRAIALLHRAEPRLL